MLTSIRSMAWPLQERGPAPEEDWNVFCNGQGRGFEVQNMRNVGRQLLSAFRQPDSMEMRFDEVAVGKIKRRGLTIPLTMAAAS